jgi:hypothetical protein
MLEFEPTKHIPHENPPLEHVLYRNTPQHLARRLHIKKTHHMGSTHLCA